MGSNSISINDTNAFAMKPQIIGKTNISIERQKFDRLTDLNYGIARNKTAKPIEFAMKNNAFIVNSICLPKPNSEPIGEELTGWGNIDQNVSKPKRTKSLQKDNYVLVDKKNMSSNIGMKNRRLYKSMS